MSDREFLKLFSGLIGALVALTIVLIILAAVLNERIKPAPDMSARAAVAERIKPIGEVTIGGSGVNLIASNANADTKAKAAGADKGQSVYDSTCAACHGTGAAGAPKLGDKAAWKDRLAKGQPKLYENAIKGFQGKTGFMPAKGGNASLPDADVKAAVDYLVAKSK
jgi:cytochrome c5